MPDVFWKIHSADLEDMLDHYEELHYRQNEILDVHLSNLSMITEGNYGGKKTRSSRFWRLLTFKSSSGESEDVIEARALINTIKKYRSKRMMIDVDADKMLEEAQRIIDG